VGSVSSAGDISGSAVGICGAIYTDGEVSAMLYCAVCSFGVGGCGFFSGQLCDLVISSGRATNRLAIPLHNLCAFSSPNMFGKLFVYFEAVFCNSSLKHTPSKVPGKLSYLIITFTVLQRSSIQATFTYPRCSLLYPTGLLSPRRSVASDLSKCFLVLTVRNKIVPNLPYLSIPARSMANDLLSCIATSVSLLALLQTMARHLLSCITRQHPVSLSSILYH
jgi:hypothetical protein